MDSMKTKSEHQNLTVRKALHNNSTIYIYYN